MTPPLGAAADPVLVIVAAQSDAAALAALVREAGYRSVAVRNCARAVAALGRRRFGCLVIDLELGRDAVHLLRAVAGRANAPAVVALADPRDPEASAEALRLGAIEVVPRPVQRDALRAALANAAEYRQAPRPAGEAEAAAVTGAGSLVLSPGLRRILESVRHLSGSRANVLIVGERGSGREVLARCTRGAPMPPSRWRWSSARGRPTSRRCARPPTRSCGVSPAPCRGRSFCAMCTSSRCRRRRRSGARSASSARISIGR